MVLLLTGVLLPDLKRGLQLWQKGSRRASRESHERDGEASGRPDWISGSRQSQLRTNHPLLIYHDHGGQRAYDIQVDTGMLYL